MFKAVKAPSDYPPPFVQENGRPVVSRVAWVGVCALVLVAPFEAVTPLVEWPGQSVTSVEAALS